jgi:MFS family permease
VIAPARRIERLYLVLTLLTTLAASFIWGVNTLFLLDAGLSNTEAFAANAFFTLGMVVFEVPTGVVADTRGRRCSPRPCSTCGCGTSGLRCGAGRSRRC